MAVLADAALDEREREVLERFVAALAEEYGEDLDGVWLYGSRARGERTHDESDIDVLVVTREGRDDDALYRIAYRVLDELGNPRVLLEPRQRSRPGWRIGGRSSRSSYATSTATRSCCTAARDPQILGAAGARTRRPGQRAPVARR